MTGTMVDTWLVGIDVGGTFTDGVLVRRGREPIAVKTPSNVADPVAGLAACLDRLGEAAGVDRHLLLERCRKLAYGTTQAANLVVEDRGARTGFLTTRGFRDTLIIAGMGRDRIGMDLRASRARPLVPRHLVFEARERVDRAGTELAPLAVQDVDAAAKALAAEEVEAVGICFLWSFRNPAHEREAAELLRQEAGCFVTLSSEVAPLMGEYERSATTALNATLGPPLQRHLAAAERQVADDGLDVPLLVMQSSGGLVPVPEAVRRPVTLLASGPAGGVLASRLLAEAMGVVDAVCADMGGTTFDVSLLTDGQFSAREVSQVAGQDVFAPSIDIESIGAGGGSIAWVDHGARLKVGPQSAGAVPGPACYGLGGQLATVTDANCRLGMLNPEGLAGGHLPLDVEAAERALARLGAPLGMSPEEAAEGTVAIVDAAMADAIRTLTVRQGLDPAGYTIFAYGGAAPLHAVALARELGITRVVLPALAPVLSAYGVVASDLLHVLSVTEATPLTDPAPLAAAYERLEERAAELLEGDGVPPARRALSRSAQVRFLGQLHALTVPVPAGPVDGAAVSRLRDDFVAAYERHFGPDTASPEAGVEAITLRVDAIGLIDRPSLEPAPCRPADAEPVGRRDVWVEGRPCSAACFRGALAPGSRVDGPALVDHWGHTAWIPPGARGEVDGLRSLVVEV